MSPTASCPSVETGPRLRSMAVQPPDSPRALARRIRDSDTLAFEAFFRTHHAPLVRYAEGIVKDPAEARDLAQDAFVRIWEGRERIDPERSLESLAYRTVRNLCLNRVRDRKNRETLLAEGYEPPARAPTGPDDALGQARLAAHLERWIDALPERQREALRLSRFSGLSHEEVAEAMGVSARTVNTHLVRALRTIRDRVKAYEPSLLDS